MSKKCIIRRVPTPRDVAVPYNVEVCERVPVVKIVKVPIHVRVEVPVKVPVYVKEYYPCYKKVIVPVEKKVYKTITNVVDVPKPVVCTSIKKVRIEVPVIKTEIVPIIKTCYVKRPTPIFETQIDPVCCYDAPCYPEPTCCGRPACGCNTAW